MIQLSDSATSSKERERREERRKAQRKVHTSTNVARALNVHTLNKGKGCGPWGAHIYVFQHTCEGIS